MGCISLTAHRIGEISIDISSKSVFDFKTSHSNTFDFDVKANDVLKFSSSTKDCFSFTCGLVCSVLDIKRLNIEPKHIWLMPSNMFTDNVFVVTNVVWHVDA